MYDERDFKRRFRVPRFVFMRIYEDIRDQQGLKRSINATWRPEAHPLQNLVAAFRVLSYADANDRGDEYFSLGQSTVMAFTEQLVHFTVERYSPAYLRIPTNGVVKATLERNSQRGMPGYLGSLDCTHWKWTSCPRGKHGMYQSRKKTRSIVIEAVCDEDLWIWHWFVGAPGSYNELKVLEDSPLFDAIQAGTWPPEHQSYTLNGRTRTMPYYLADGIYQQYALLATPFPAALGRTREQLVYNRVQEGLRKDVERLFGVLTSRFRVAMHPALYRSAELLTSTSRAVAIIHIMVVEQRREQYIGRRRAAAAATEDASRARRRERRERETAVARVGGGIDAVNAAEKEAVEAADEGALDAQGLRGPDGRLDLQLPAVPGVPAIDQVEEAPEGSFFADSSVGCARAAPQSI